jgi:hypothetical protein
MSAKADDGADGTITALGNFCTPPGQWVPSPARLSGTLANLRKSAPGHFFKCWFPNNKRIRPEQWNESVEWP